MPIRPTALITAVLLLTTTTVGCGGAEGDKVGLIGDSITDLSRDPLTNALGSDYQIEIVGKFGARSDQVIEDVKVIAASKPSAVVINIGTNDALQQVPAAQTAANIQQILDLLEDVGCRYLVQVNTGITDTASGGSRSAEATAVNEQLSSLAEKNDDVDVVDWNQTIADNGGNSAITYDTVHLSDKGIVLMAEAYQQALADC